MNPALHLASSLAEGDELHERLAELTPTEILVDGVDLHWSSPLGRGTPCAINGCVRGVKTAALCSVHYERWRAAGAPELASYLPEKPVLAQRLRLTSLPQPLRLEIGYGLHRLRQQEHHSLGHRAAELLIRKLESSHVTTLLSEEGVALTERGNGARAQGWRSFLTFTLDEVEAVAGTATADHEMKRDRWRLRRLGFTQHPHWSFSFEEINPPWLRETSKRFVRWRVSTGNSSTTCWRDVKMLTRLSSALTDVAGHHAHAADLTHAVVDRLRVMLVDDGLNPNGRRIALTSIRTFFTTVRQHDWLPGLPSTTAVYSEDLPRPSALPARAVSEFVMTQLESTDNLNKLTDPRWRLLFPLLMQTGLRLADGLRLPIDCVVRDQQQAPYLRYLNHKMKRESMVPISDELASAVIEQAHRVLGDYPDARVLFPRTSQNPRGHHATSNPVAHTALKNWLANCKIRDEAGRPVNVTAHQFRHTFGTRLINNDVPQEVVRRLLDHNSTEMTAHYARLHDTTVREHWERARKVNVDGESVLVAEDSPLADAAWMKQHLSRASMALPNGYCGLPLQQTCPHANACLTCPVFITTPDFLDQHREQLVQTQQIVERAQNRGQLRLVEMNQRIATNLTNIITALEPDGEGTDSDAS